FCLAFALVKRRWWLAGLSLAIVGCHVFWVVPDFMRDRPSDAATTIAGVNQPSPSHVRIFFANVCLRNTEFDSMLREIEAADPDIVALVELGMSWQEAFRNSPIMAKYHYGNRGEPWHGCDVIVFSKIPMQNHVERYFADRFMESFDVLLGSQQFHLICLHSPRPMNFYLNDYDGFWKRAVRQIARAPRPLVVVGDCNATQYSLVYNQVKETGLHSAHEEYGRGYATTWPNGTLPVPPIRIDQAFLSDEVECVRIEEGIGRGSDHKPLILDIRLRDAVSPQLSPESKP
ncbi:MAG TPA: endonuclease/exonuclease/phosphatase family protein, partial [Lacipirellulaceae bacterium]|nr:endonuclease/exonuclease/phosphatase family protein [Lacipirellulaceae bacterium]